MPKFKIGDRVKLISMDPWFGFGPYVKTGAIGIVTHVAVATRDYHPEICVNFPKHSGWNGMHSEFILVPKKPTTPKTKEKKSMTENKTAKKPGTSHGKPTTKGLLAQPKAKTTPKPKYPEPRVQRELITGAKPLEKRTKAELIATTQDLSNQFNNLAADHCIAGTKLDRALVDLKEAKVKIKELSKALEAAK